MKLINKLIDALANLFLLVTSDVTPSHENPDRYNVEISRTKITARMIANELLYRYKKKNHYVGKISVGVVLLDGLLVVYPYKQGFRVKSINNDCLFLSIDDFSSMVLSFFDDIKDYRCDIEEFIGKYEGTTSTEWSYAEI